jgi:Fe-S oxidoreductase
MNSPHSLEERRDFLARCSRCSQCKFVATPKSNAYASGCPSIDYGQFHAYSGGGQLINGLALLEGKAGYTDELLRSVHACTMCGGCDSACKVNFAETIEPLDSLYALRAKIVDEGHSPVEHRTLMGHLHNEGNRLGRPRNARAHWANGLSLGVVGNAAGEQAAEVMLHIGGDLAYAQQHWPALRAIVQALSRAGESLVHAGVQEGPSGGLAFDLGYTDDARSFATTMVEQVRRSAVRTLVTFSASALAAFRGVYPRFGLSFGSVRVLHITEYLHELVSRGRLQLNTASALHAGPAAYHDPCKLGRLAEPWQPHDPGLDRHMGGIYVSRAPQAMRFGHQGCYEAPRALMGGIGMPVVELERSHASSYCCGAGGGVKETVPDAARLAARNRLAEVQSCGASTLVTACSACANHLAETAQVEQLPVQVLHLLDILAEALQPALAKAD